MTDSRETRDLAVMTIVQDEPEFIHPWVNHYRRHVADSRDLYVLLHVRPGGDGRPSDAWSTAEALLHSHHRVTVIPVHHASSFDHAWLVGTVEVAFALLLRSYTWVLFAEADEFVFPVAPSPDRTLLDFVRRLPAEEPKVIRTTGIEILHLDPEPPLPASLYEDGSNAALTAAMLLADRNHCFDNPLYSKPLLANTRVRWEQGFHRAKLRATPIADVAPSPELVLLHLHKVDFDLALRRSRRARAKKWSATDLERGLGRHNRIAEVAEMRDFWERDGVTGQPLAPGQVKPLPDPVRRAIG
ncbi:MAG TPA: hypothetical protein PKA74_06340 [Bauldia sp.]|nr:hypothetical protein [Bauldia sp.]